MLSRFAARIAALQPDELLRLEPGDLTAIAKAVRRSVPHVQMVISRQRPGSQDLRDDIAEVVGVPVERIQPSGGNLTPYELSQLKREYIAALRNGASAMEARAAINRSIYCIYRWRKLDKAFARDVDRYSRQRSRPHDGEAA